MFFDRRCRLARPAGIGPYAAAGLTLAVLAALAGCATQQNQGTGGTGGAGASADTAINGATVARAGSSAARAEVLALDAPIAAILEDLGESVRTYHAHVSTLSNPWFGGRATGERGLEDAARYIEHYFREFGLEPAFEDVSRTPGGAEVVEGSYRQHFTVPGPVDVNAASLTWSAAESSGVLRPEHDFDPIPMTGSGRGQGDVVFVGYAIDGGPEGYSSFEGDADLTGKIALVLRFEPMDSGGKSRWADGQGWSARAGLNPKIRSLASRGVAGIVMVAPPGADDPRAGELMTIRGSRLGASGEIPVVNVTAEAASKMIAAAGPGRSLEGLVAIADAGSHHPIELTGLTARLNVEVSRSEIATTNVGAVLPGKGSLSNEYLVIGAHYDHVGMGHFGSRSPGNLHPGADDNASGTGGVLLAAELLIDRYDALPAGAEARSIIFLAFSGEEMGLLGSRHYAANPSAPLSNISAMLNMDMIGRLRDGALEILGVGSGAEFDALLKDHIRRSGMKVTLSAAAGGRSDHAPFSDQGVPALAFHTGLHDDYHAPGDVASRVHYKGAVRVVELVTEFAMDLAARPERVTFPRRERAAQQPAPTQQRMNFAVRLGVAPGNYADDETGVVVGSVSEGTSAADAGLLAGDRIVRWNGEELLDVQGMMKHLAAAKPGDVAKLVVIRAGRETPIDVTLKAAGGAN